MFSTPIETDPDQRVVPLSEAAQEDRANYFVEFCIKHNVTANMITAARIVLTPLLLVLISFQYYESSVVLLLALVLSDVLDGQVARTVRKRHPGKGITSLGKILDPLSDKFLVVGTLLVMPWVPAFVVASITTLEILLTLMRPWQKWMMRKSGNEPAETIGSNDYGKTKTWLEDIMLLAYLLQVCNPQYTQLAMFAGSMTLGSLSFTGHVRTAFHKT